MSTSETQRGSLRKRNLPKPSTLLDLRRVVVEYKSANNLWAEPHSFDIVSVTAVNGDPIEPGEYWFVAQEAGLFPRDTDSALTLENRRWERR
jgi:hypothetical protein